MSAKPSPSKAAPDQPKDPPPAAGEEPGTNAVQHEPDPNAKPAPDGQHKYVPRSPYTSGND